MFVAVVTLVQGCAQTAVPDRLEADPASRVASAVTVPADLEWMTPEMVRVSGITVLMIGSGCPVSIDFKPSFLEDDELLPDDVRRVFAERSEVDDSLKYYPSPLFITYLDGTPIDVHSGAVESINSFATDANRRAFKHLLVRSGLLQEVDGLIESRTDPPPLGERRSWDYRSLKFVDLDDADLVGVSFKRTLLSTVSLRGADLSNATFEGTIMSHVDLEGTNLNELQAAGIYFFSATCPDGTLSTDNGGTCLGHLLDGDDEDGG